MKHQTDYDWKPMMDIPQENRDGRFVGYFDLTKLDCKAQYDGSGDAYLCINRKAVEANDASEVWSKLIYNHEDDDSTAVQLAQVDSLAKIGFTEICVGIARQRKFFVQSITNSWLKEREAQ